VTTFFTRRIDWRESPTLWAPLAWFAAVLWPGAVFALVVLPPTRPEGRVVLVGLLAACLGVAGILRLLEWERSRDGAPRTRLGVIARFLFFGFVYTVLTTVAATLAQGAAAMFGPHGLSQNLAETNSTLTLGFGVLVFTAAIGVSWSLWAGIAVSLIAFSPRQESVRLRGFNLQTLSDPDSSDASAKPMFKRPQPRPETEVEAALRPDWD
jgi:hypothetical protein